MSEHCKSYGAQNCPAMPYWLYGVATGFPAATGGLTSALTPAVADSGCGTPGLQRLLRPPINPACPSEQRPSSPPMSPIPGIEHGPVTAALVAASVRAAITRWCARPAATPLPAAPPGPP